MKIYVDADACPVKKEIERVATRNKIVVLLVSNGGLRPILHPFIQNIFVSADADAADKWIVDNGHANDLVITADIILADNCIKKGMLVLKPNGEELNQKNIKEKLYILGASRRPPTPNFRIFGFFGVFGPFSRFFVVGDSPGVSGNPFSCPEIDFSS